MILRKQIQSNIALLLTWRLLTLQHEIFPQYSFPWKFYVQKKKKRESVAALQLQLLLYPFVRQSHHNDVLQIKTDT